MVGFYDPETQKLAFRVGSHKLRNRKKTRKLGVGIYITVLAMPRDDIEPGQ